MADEKLTTEVAPAVLPTADQLIALSKEEFTEFKVAFETAVKAKAAEELAEVKEKFADYIATYKTYILPIIKYGAGAYVVLKIAGLI